ncbi:MAG: hypothetical protein Q9M39_05775 [Sulfurovum sp.]|nr:hypothetical protein [Sulfurovum sp.]
MMKKILLISLSLTLGIFYYMLIQLSVTDLKHSNAKSNTFSFVLHSNINQEVKLHIATERFKLHWVKCNDTQILFPAKKMQWFEGVGEQLSFALKKGENHCQVETYNSRRTYTPNIKQKITFFDYSILFILLGIPIFYLIFIVFIKGLEQIKPRSIAVLSIIPKDTTLPKLLWAILFAGILIRIFYFQKFGIMTFQHDWHGHIEFIKVIAENWTLPLASKGLEYPQQPLYYLITGGLYALLTQFGLDDGDALYGLGYFSLLCSMLFLYYSYRFLTLVTQSLWVRTVAIIFVSLTPSLVYLCARINNDALVMALSAYTLYAIVNSYQSGFKTGFYAALIGVSLLFMTKISAAPMELLLFGLLIVAFYQVEESQRSIVQKRLYCFSVVGMFLLGFTLLRVYLPIEGTLHMVNSSAHYPNQSIEALGLDYFGTFHITSLLQAGYSHVFGDDAIRYSFLTYQYGTMFFGEFDYTYFVQKSEGLKAVMQGILLLGLLYVLGFLTYIIKLHQAPLLHKLLFATLVLNLLLILKFMFSYPVICNTDFRYFVASFALFALVFAQGLDSLRHSKWMRYVLNASLGMLVVFELVFFGLMLLV